MKNLYIFIAVLFIPWSFSVAKYDEFEDGDDIMEYDDNDFAEFEDVNEDAVTESPQRIITTEDDEEEATVELEGQDENQEDFDDVDAQVMPHLLPLWSISTPYFLTCFFGFRVPSFRFSCCLQFCLLGRWYWEWTVWWRGVWRLWRETRRVS